MASLYLLGWCFLVSIGITISDLPTLLQPYRNLLMRVDDYILPLPLHNFDAFEPYVDEKTMMVHILGHHDAYKTKTNSALQAWREEEPDNAFARESILNIVSDIEKVPEKWRETLRNHGGGFVNHCFYFGIMSPPAEESPVPREPTGTVLEDVTAAYGGYDGLKEEVNNVLKGHFGAGYIWLVRDPKGPKGNLKVIATKNQDSPITDGLRPILTLDVWEHAYYLKHNYKRWEYVKDFWMLVDWDYVTKLDNWWTNLAEEQQKADERVVNARASLKKQKEAKKKTEL